jgi:hypothetical protein
VPPVNIILNYCFAGGPANGCSAVVFIVDFFTPFTTKEITINIVGVSSWNTPLNIDFSSTISA